MSAFCPEFAPTDSAPAPSGGAPSDGLGTVPRRLAARNVVATASLVFLASFLIRGAARSPAHPNSPLVMKGASARDDKPRTTLRLGTFNIHGARNVACVQNLDLTARTLDGLDVAGLQEVYGRTLTEPRDQAELLAERLDAAAVFAPIERRWWRDNIGNAVVSRVPLRNWRRVPLEGTRRNKFRNALMVETELGDRQNGIAAVRIVVVHVDNQADHDSQLAQVVSLFLALQEPAVLMGDLNTRADDPQLARLLANPSVTAAANDHRPDGKPTRGVDWIIARGLCCVASETRDLGASDHPAVVAELALVARR